ncbi:MAG: acetyl-CoA carboxylase carboxyltransferase subunit alpha [Oscillospiraceae bacterium]|jgi:acetyl-CoA carboxylase carboxyl transferase subunit alpha|nr:acetyl-CoA carboxylase carboxyltransferase subunit alpha [Oscillospiraceae bacterium]
MAIKEAAMSPAVRKMELARLRGRPTLRDYIPLLFEDFIELYGDRMFADDSAVLGGLALLEDRPVTVIGHVKGKSTRENIDVNFGMAHPEGYRKALRLMKQAGKFGRPVVCLVDTPGAFCGVGAEERGQGEAIARNLMEMMALTVPVVSVVTGEGGSGGALGLAVANRVLMLENAVYSVISPKGCASILWKDPAREYEAADLLQITAEDLLRLGVVDGIIPEPEGGAHRNVRKTALAIRAAVTAALTALEEETDLAQKRYDKFRAMGVFQIDE